MWREDWVMDWGGVRGAGNVYLICIQIKSSVSSSVIESSQQKIKVFYNRKKTSILFKFQISESIIKKYQQITNKPICWTFSCMHAFVSSGLQLIQIFISNLHQFTVHNKKSGYYARSSKPHKWYILFIILCPSNLNKITITTHCSTRRKVQVEETHLVICFYVRLYVLHPIWNKIWTTKYKIAGDHKRSVQNSSHLISPPLKSTCYKTTACGLGYCVVSSCHYDSKDWNWIVLLVS